MILETMVFYGLDTTANARLHAFFKTTTVLCDEIVECTVIGFTKEENDKWRLNKNRLPFARITKSEWDDDEGHYVTEIKVLAEAKIMDVELFDGKNPRYDEYFFLRCPRAVIEGIHKALELFPKKQSLVPCEG